MNPLAICRGTAKPASHWADLVGPRSSSGRSAKRPREETTASCTTPPVARRGARAHAISPAFSTPEVVELQNEQILQSRELAEGAAALAARAEARAAPASSAPAPAASAPAPGSSASSTATTR